jgi:hypothetical protein
MSLWGYQPEHQRVVVFFLFVRRQRSQHRKADFVAHGDPVPRVQPGQGDFVFVGLFGDGVLVLPHGRKLRRVKRVDGNIAFLERFQPAHVILVRMGDHHPVQPVDLIVRKRPEHRLGAFLGAGVDQIALVSKHEKRGVRLADVHEQRRNARFAPAVVAFGHGAAAERQRRAGRAHQQGKGECLHSVWHESFRLQVGLSASARKQSDRCA